MRNINASIVEDDELEDLEPEPGDAENVKGGASDDSGSSPEGKGGGSGG